GDTLHYSNRCPTIESVDTGTLLARVFGFGAMVVDAERDRKRRKQRSQELREFGDRYANAVGSGPALQGPPEQTPAETSPRSTSDEIATQAEPGLETEESRESACIPCSKDHISTCVGALNEALRFARQEGVGAPRVRSRLGICRSELNIMERIDLRAEVTSKLPPEERELAGDILNASRNMRHDMTELRTVEDLETLAGKTSSLYNEIDRRYDQILLGQRTPQQSEELRARAQRVRAKLGMGSESPMTLEEAKRMAAEQASEAVEKRWQEGKDEQ
ncbi:MAG: hypothetical protein ACOC58_04985, partial [Chloroflexota bacterium]